MIQNLEREHGAARAAIISLSFWRESTVHPSETSTLVEKFKYIQD